MPSSTDLRVREAKPEDYAAVGALTVAAYRDDGQTGPDHPYETVLRDVVARSAAGTVLVCESAGVVAGAVLFVLPGSEYAELSAPGEAEFRMLAVSPAAQRRGVGEALVHSCVDRARELSCTAVVICVRDFAEDAQRLYKRIGFVREPRLDWSPMDGVTLLGLRYQL